MLQCHCLNLGLLQFTGAEGLVDMSSVTVVLLSFHFLLYMQLCKDWCRYWLGCVLTCNLTVLSHLQDSFVGAWQQADPAIDQVPFTFPPVHGPSKLGKGKKARIGAFRNRGARPNGNQYARDKQRGRGFMVHEADAKLLPRPPKPPKEKHLNYMKGKQRDARSGVSPAEYAKALDQEL